MDVQVNALVRGQRQQNRGERAEIVGDYRQLDLLRVEEEGEVGKHGQRVNTVTFRAAKQKANPGCENGRRILKGFATLEHQVDAVRPHHQGVNRLPRLAVQPLVRNVGLVLASAKHVDTADQTTQQFVTFLASSRRWQVIRFRLELLKLFVTLEQVKHTRPFVLDRPNSRDVERRHLLATTLQEHVELRKRINETLNQKSLVKPHTHLNTWLIQKSLSSLVKVSIVDARQQIDCKHTLLRARAVKHPREHDHTRGRANHINCSSHVIHFQLADRKPLSLVNLLGNLERLSDVLAALDGKLHLAKAKVLLVDRLEIVLHKHELRVSMQLARALEAFVTDQKGSTLGHLGLVQSTSGTLVTSQAVKALATHDLERVVVTNDQHVSDSKQPQRRTKQDDHATNAKAAVTSRLILARAIHAQEELGALCKRFKHTWRAPKSSVPRVQEHVACVERLKHVEWQIEDEQVEAKILGAGVTAILQKLSNGRQPRRSSRMGQDAIIPILVSFEELGRRHHKPQRNQLLRSVNFVFFQHLTKARHSVFHHLDIAQIQHQRHCGAVQSLL